MMEFSLKNPLKRSFEEFNSSTEAMDAGTAPSVVPRDYQIKIYEVAMERNTIALLETGAGKTVVALMLIKEIGKSLRNDNGDKKLIVFLAPTVHLVHQQCKAIKSYTELKVEEYYGDKGVDGWNANTWEKEINDCDVLVMTPQIYLDALRKAYLCIEVFCFIVLDECHRATGKHPYAQIMKEFYHKSTKRPKIFGMTASPFSRKGVSSIKDSEDQIRELECLLDSQVYKVDNSSQLEKHIPSAKQECRFYSPPHPRNLGLNEKLESIKHEFDAVLLPTQHNEEDVKNKSLQDRFSRDHSKILFCLENLGSICAHEAVEIFLEKAHKVKQGFEVYKESLAQCRYYLQEAVPITEGPSENKRLEAVDIGSDAVTTGRISSKLHELFQIFRLFGKNTDVLCIIFVERIITAKVITRLMKKIPDISHLNVAYLTGSKTSTDGLSRKVQREVLKSFRDGKVNLLFATDVVEEGIDVASCSSVIRFDLPKTVRSYIQSRGRARQEDSHYIIMLERDNTDQRNHMLYLTQSENSMNQTAMNRDPEDHSVKPCDTKKTAAYVVESTGALVTANSSVNLIYGYCNKLRNVKNVLQKPKFETLMEGSLFRCKLTLPATAAFQIMIGPEAHSSRLSKQLVCLDAVKKLHIMGALDDNLVPIGKEQLQNDSESNGDTVDSGPGSTKRKELHGSVTVHTKSGTWGDKLDGAVFYAYKMDFVCDIPQQKYSSFVLLLETKLDDDVGNINMELYLLSKFVKATISFHGEISLDAEKLADAKCFQELIFNGLFGKLFIKSSGDRKLLFQAEELLWNSSNMYLLLPVESMDEASKENLKINWMGIKSCVSTVDFLKENAWLSIEKPGALGSNSLVDVSDSVMTEVDRHIIHLANRSASVDNLKEMVVVAVHTGRIYSILDIVDGSSSESPFDGDAVNYPSFADYYRKKYGIVLKRPEQPLVLLKQSHNSHNLLVDFRKEETKTDGKKSRITKPQQHAHMPPELLVGTDLRAYDLKSVYLLPSIMYRLESLMLASQLREEISRQTGFSEVSSSLILEALATLRCNDSFSMERLELLGDSVLKYAVTCHLFLKNPKKPEGYLSGQRSMIVSNASLHKFGTDRKLQEYIQDCPFEPRRWTAPGQLSIWPSPCNHGLDTMEVPLEDKFFSEDPKLFIGKTCDKGHRWMGSKTISDCVEALIGAYYVSGGFAAAVSFLNWLGIKAEVEHSLIDDSIKVASLYSYTPKAGDIADLETKLRYKFAIKGLLLEAMTHETKTGQDVGYCYERLEFLGDAVLDILITRYLYDNHINLDPGDLTDLRSASVNNDNFAIVAVRRNLHPHLLLGSSSLESQISEFVKLVSDRNLTVLTPDTKGPKVLGDLVESIAGAVLVDSKLNLEEVWKVFEPILSPIVTPEKLELPPTRELNELCDSLGYFVKEQYKREGSEVHAQLQLQLEIVGLGGQGSGPNRKAAKGMAALQLLKQLNEKGISRRKHDKDHAKEGDGNVSTEVSIETLGSLHKSYKTLDEPVPETNIDSNKQACDSNKNDLPVIPPVETRKGAPRNALYALCKKQQWPMPTFQTSEQKFRKMIQLGDTTGFNSYESEISLTMPGFGKVEVMGEARADKKSSFDSAALAMLLELEKQGKIVVQK